MPWTAESFKARHWHGATPSQAERASKMANAMLESGTDEATAIATAIKHSKMRKIRRKQSGKA